MTPFNKLWGISQQEYLTCLLHSPGQVPRLSTISRVRDGKSAERVPGGTGVGCHDQPSFACWLVGRSLRKIYVVRQVWRCARLRSRRIMMFFFHSGCFSHIFFVSPHFPHIFHIFSISSFFPLCHYVIIPNCFQCKFVCLCLSLSLRLSNLLQRMSQIFVQATWPVGEWSPRSHFALCRLDASLGLFPCGTRRERCPTGWIRLQVYHILWNRGILAVYWLPPRVVQGLAPR